MLLVVSLVVGCRQSTPEPKTPAGEVEKAPESRVKRGTNGEIALTLEAEVQKLMGLQTEALNAVSLAPELKAYGRVLDASPLASLVADMVAAQAADTASQAELARLKTLASLKNASERALQAATAAAARDQAQLESTRLRLMANWGSALAKREDLPAVVQSLGALESVLVQLDLPAGEGSEVEPASAVLFTLGDSAQPVSAQYLGLAPMVDVQMQGHGFLFLVHPNSARLVPGQAVTGYLKLPGEARTGVELPRGAVLRFNGATWVYKQRNDTTFERCEVTLGRPLQKGWFVHEGSKPGEKVVTVGAQQMLSEELKDQAAE